MIALETIVHLIKVYGYLVLLPLSTIEGPIVGTIAGFFVSLGYLDIFTTYLVLLVGDLLGDALYYSIGRFWKEPVLRFFHGRFNFTKERIAKFEKYFIKHDWKILFLAKVQAVGSVILFSAGVARMPFWRFIGWNLVGSIPKVAFFEALGYYFGSAYNSIDGYIKEAAIATFLVAIAAIGAYFLFRKKEAELE